jgi:hypothetical protein
MGPEYGMQAQRGQAPPLVRAIYATMLAEGVGVRMVPLG